MFRTTYRTKNVPEKLFIGENNVPDRLFIAAKTEKFRKDYLSEQNIPNYLSREKSFGQATYWSKMFRTDYLTEKNVPDRLFIGGECSGQTIYRSNKYCEWKVTHKSRTDLFPVRPATSCPQAANKRQRTCQCHSHLPNLLPL